MHFKCMKVIAFWIKFTGNIRFRKFEVVKLHRGHRKEVRVDVGLYKVLTLTPETEVPFLIVK